VQHELKSCLKHVYESETSITTIVIFLYINSCHLLATNAAHCS